MGVLINYFAAQIGNPTFLFLGVLLVMVAIVLNAVAYKKSASTNQKVTSKGIILSLVADFLVSFFYRLIAGAMDLENFQQPAVGKMTPYTAVFIFSVGIFISNFLFNTILMK